MSVALPSKCTNTRSAPRMSGLRDRNATRLTNEQSGRRRTLRDETVAPRRLMVTVTVPLHTRAASGVHRPATLAAPEAQRGGACTRPVVANV